MASDRSLMRAALDRPWAEPWSAQATLAQGMLRVAAALEAVLDPSLARTRSLPWRRDRLISPRQPR